MHVRAPIAALVLAFACLAGAGASRLLAQETPQEGTKDAKNAAPAESPKLAKVRRLVAASGAEATSRQTLDAMLQQLESNASLPRAFVAKFRSKVDVKALVEIAVRAYDRHLDEKTVDAALAYYESESGKAFVAKQPALLQEAMTAGTKYGEELARECIEELRSESEAK